MTTLIVWVFVFTLMGQPELLGVMAASKSQCHEAWKEVTQNAPVLTISECTPIKLKEYVK